MQFCGVSVVIFAVLLSCGLGYPQGEPQDPSPPAQPTNDDSDMYLEPQDQDTQAQENLNDRQLSQSSFYPSFPSFQNPPLGHSRPFYYQQEGAYSHRPTGYHQQQVSYDTPRFSGYKDDGFNRVAANSESQGILGSGNFGVIRGGTFYDDNNDNSESKHYDRDFSSFYGGNSHGGPFYYGGGGGGGGGGIPNPRPHQHEQFANFRDFADINTPTNQAYSQYVVVYANKNSTKNSAGEGLDQQPTVLVHRPKNIIESLQLLDLETTTEEIPQKKLSKSKAKLASTFPEKKAKHKTYSKARSPKDAVSEPLLALS